MNSNTPDEGLSNEETAKGKDDQRVSKGQHLPQMSISQQIGNAWNKASVFVGAHDKILSLIVNVAALLGAYYLLSLTGDQIEVSRDIAHKQLRAYIVAVEPILAQYTLGDPVKVTLVIKNCGQTPAYDVKDSISVRILETGIEPDTTKFFDSIGKLVYGSQDDERSEIHSIDKIATETDGRRFWNDSTHTFLYGKITYRDIFGDDHWTHFCFRDTLVQSMRGEFKEFRTYKYYNDAN